MGQVKLLEDRIHAVEEAAANQCADVDMYFDPVEKTWMVLVNDRQVGEPGTYLEMIEALETELEL